VALAEVFPTPDLGVGGLQFGAVFLQLLGEFAALLVESFGVVALSLFVLAVDLAWFGLHAGDTALDHPGVVFLLLVLLGCPGLSFPVLGGLLVLDVPAHGGVGAAAGPACGLFGVVADQDGLPALEACRVVVGALEVGVGAGSGRAGVFLVGGGAVFVVHGFLFWFGGGVFPPFPDSAYCTTQRGGGAYPPTGEQDRSRWRSNSSNSIRATINRCRA